MKLLVFGQTGQVARELARALTRDGDGRAPEAVFLGRETADLMQPESCGAAIRLHRPDAVINTAAWTAVDRAETEEAAATTVNGAAPGAMAQAAADLGLPFLHVSTDYVFSGEGTRGWSETDRPAPLNAYGRSKLAGETAVLAAGGNPLILRTSWVFSAHGTNFVKTMLRLSESRSTLNVVEDQIGGPTPASALAATLLMLAGALRAGAAGGVYHYAGAPETSWAGFAREIFARAGRAVTVTGIPSSAYPAPARRPLNSRLDGAGLQRDFGIMPADWRADLSRVIGELSHG
ncbi:dTDP-4-dehydrorhamnose reductase [Neotabrizicola sp. VNH66]|uniref:dTDP-4-dehydrorhamnose reductase n=1 Tax=Neotabrizicola sp. VNH66 TaxID=3400918 RepID=UPI003C041173